MLESRQEIFVVPVNGQPAYGGGYFVFAYPVGAQVSAMSNGSSNVQVHNSGSFEPQDKAVVWRPSTGQMVGYSDQIADVPDKSTIVFSSGLVVYSGDLLINVCQDQGAAEPQWLASRMEVYADPAKALKIPYARLTCSAQGEYGYYHQGDGRFWEVVLAPNGQTLVAVKTGWGGQDERLNTYDYGSADLTKANSSATRTKLTGQAVYNPAT